MMDQQIKERMVGAAVLVLAAVIFIPMILAGSPQEQSGLAPRMGQESPPSPAVRSASADHNTGFSSRIVPLGGTSPVMVPTPEQAGHSVVEDGAEKPVARPVEKLAPRPSAAASASTKPTPKPARKQAAVRKAIVAPSQPGVVDGWVVQLGSFSSMRNAHALRDRLKAKGFKAFARSSGKGAEAVTRVYVGPDTDRDSAQRRVSRLYTETRLKGIVIRHPK